MTWAPETKPTTDREYVGRVRRHRPSALLPLIAQASARYAQQDAWKESLLSTKYAPWALADVARVSLTCGNEFRSEANAADLLRVLDMYSQLEDPYFYDVGSDPDAFDRYLLRVTGEQLPYQEFFFQESARSAAMLTQTTSSRELRCLRPGWEEELLGATVSQYVGIAQLLWSTAITNGGRFNPAVLHGPDAEQICARIPLATITSVTEQHFVTDLAAFRKKNGQHRESTDHLLRRFEYNPLRGTPLLRGYGPGFLAPVSHLILAKASPLGIYYTGVDRYGSSFAEDLGGLFEAYVGRQLKLLSHAVVHSEVVYDRNAARSVDWIVVTDRLVLLVEAKSVRPTRQLRLATEERTNEITRMLAKGYQQIDRTAELIASGRKEFSEIPSDRPVLGLIVTMESFHIANVPTQRAHLPATDVPVTVCSISELENLVTITDAPVDQLLLERAEDADRSTSALREALQGHAKADNAVLDAGWASYAWSRARQSPPQ